MLRRHDCPVSVVTDGRSHAEEPPHAQQPQNSLIIERVRKGICNARAKGRRIGRPPQTQLSSELRADIANAYQSGGTSLRLLAKKFGTSLATVQRCVRVSRTRD